MLRRAPRAPSCATGRESFAARLLFRQSYDFHTFVCPRIVVKVRSVQCSNSFQEIVSNESNTFGEPDGFGVETAFSIGFSTRLFKTASTSKFLECLASTGLNTFWIIT